VPELSAPHTSASDPSRRVLVAEDNVINQRVAVAMLRHLGFDVDVVADGADAVRAAVATHYRLILMDCQLPGLDGYRATAEIRRLQEPPRRTPVIAVTGSEAAADRQRCLAAGMDDHVAKPLRLKALTSLISRWAPQGPPASVTDPTQTAPDLAVPTAHDVQHTLQHLTDGLTDNQQPDLGSTVTDTATNLLDAVGDLGNTLVGTLDDTLDGLGSALPSDLPTLP